jgi:hypothetical protein
VCEQRSAEYQCDRCGALVCDRHYDASAGICTECAAEMGVGDGGDGNGNGSDRRGPDRDPDSEHRI